MPAKFFLSPTAIGQLRYYKKWSLERFGRNVTKKYFQDLDAGFQYIADHYQRFPARPELTGENELGIYPVREHYVVFVALKDGVHIASILRQAQDVPTILKENSASIRRELAQSRTSKP